MTRLAEVPIRAFLDTNPAYHGMTLRGAPILAPEAVARLSPSRCSSARCSTPTRSRRACASSAPPTSCSGFAA